MNLTPRGRSVLVVGGGAVGRRKTGILVAAGAAVTVVDPRAELSLTGVRHIPAAFHPSHLGGVSLAFACGPADVNAAVVAAAKAGGVWVCSATDPTAGDFVLPSVARRGDLTFAVSTGGASPALAKRIAAEVLEKYDDSYAEWVRVLGEVRAAVLTAVNDSGERRRLLEHFADPVWLDRIRTAGAEVVKGEMMRTLEPGTP